MVNVRRAVVGAALASYAVRAAVLALNARVFPKLEPVTPPASERADEAFQPGVGRPKVSLLVPCRGEAENLPKLLPRLLAQGADELVICDDGDNGDALADAEALGVRVVTAPPKPEEWIGKNWACWTLAQAATGDVLVFTDADTVWEAGALDAIIDLRERLDADLLSVLPRSTNIGWGVRLVAPLVETTVLTIAPWPLTAADRLGCGVAAGSLMCFTREGYEMCGGHPAAPDLIQEDMALARLVQHAGGRARHSLGNQLLGISMYPSYRDAVKGFGKSIVAIHDGSRVLTAVSWLGIFGTHTLPWLLPASPAVWTLRLASLSDRALVNWVVGRRRPADLAEGLLGPITPPAVLPGVLLGCRRKLEWKGRLYDQRTTRPPRKA